MVPIRTRYENVTHRPAPFEAPQQMTPVSAGPRLPNPTDPDSSVRAVLFDLDGTLYRQPPVRALMALELLTLPFYGPLQAPQRWRALAAYRRAQERLRVAGGARSATTQVVMAATEAGMPVGDVERLANEWIHVRPLKYLRLCRAPGVEALVSWLAGKGIRMGLLSDYPAAAKLAALGLAGRLAPVLCATDPEIGTFKPHPRGFLRAASLWQLPPSEVLVVGDRIDADAAGAAAAGMPCVIIGRQTIAQSRQSTPGRRHAVLPSLEVLHHVLEHGR